MGGLYKMRYIHDIFVTSNSFSKNKTLRKKMSDIFPNTTFNDTNLPLSSNQLIKNGLKCDGLVLGLEKIDERVLSKLKNLKFISKYGVGIDNIDLELCKKKNIKVLYTKGVNSDSVTELALSYIILLSRNALTANNLLKNKKIWKKNGGLQMNELTIGIIGFGRIGKKIASYLKKFGCTILVNDLVDYSNICKKNNYIFCSKNYLLKNSDVITLHASLNKSSYQMVNKNFLKNMKFSSFLVNTSRGDLINEEDFLDSIRRKKIAGAALDVFKNEPKINPNLLKQENVFCTPHIAGNSNKAILDMGESAINNIIKYINKKNKI